MKDKYTIYTLVDGKKTLTLDLPKRLDKCTELEIKGAIKRAGYDVVDEVTRIEKLIV